MKKYTSLFKKVPYKDLLKNIEDYSCYIDNDLSILNKKHIYLKDINELRNFSTGLYTIDIDDGRFDFILKMNYSDHLLVFLSGGMGAQIVQPPLFHRIKWNKLFNENIMYISDPMHYKFSYLNTGWYIGTKKYNWHQTLAHLITYIANLIKIPTENIIIYGSSAGGYAAIQIASKILYSTSISINPQLIITKYHSYNTFKTITNIDMENDIRNNAIDTLTKCKNTNFFIIQNLLDNELKKHFDPLFLKLDSDICYGLNLFKNIAIWLYQAKGGHNAFENINILYHIFKYAYIFKEKKQFTSDIYNDALNISEFWKDIYDPKYNSLQGVLKSNNILYSGKDLQLKHIPSLPNGKYKNIVIITYTPWHSWQDPEKSSYWTLGFGENIFSKYGIDELHIISNKNNWYQTPEIQNIIPLIKRITDGAKIFSYGSSMGAFGAINFSYLFNSIFIAFSPQASLLNLPISKAWENSRPYFKQSNIINEKNTNARGYLFYDPFIKNDDVHAKIIKKKTQCKNIKVPHTGHTSLNKINNYIKIEKVIISIINNNFNKRSFYKELYSKLNIFNDHENIKHICIYKYNKHGIKNLLVFLTTLFYKKNINFYTQMGKILIDDFKDYKNAKILFIKALVLKKDEEIYRQIARCLFYTGKKEIAIKYTSKRINYDKTNPFLIGLLGAFYFLVGDKNNSLKYLKASHNINSTIPWIKHYLKQIEKQ